jgi:two-component system, sensor histidine kinase and response regulator
MNPERVNILLVDDRPANLVLMEGILGDLGQNLVEATSGEEALQHLVRTDFAVILLDVAMPGMDGFETASMIRRFEKAQHTPIIFVTATEPKETHISRGYAIGAVDYLFKPIVPEILRAKVAAFVDMFQAKAKTDRFHEAALRELEAKNTQLEQFMYTVSHDLKSPLITIGGLVGVIVKDLDRGNLERAKTLAAQVARVTDNAGQQIDTLLRVSRAGRSIESPAEVPMDALVEEAARLFSSRLTERGVTLQIAPNLPTVRSDRVRLLSAVQSLLDNALKYMGEQPNPKIEIGFRQEGTENVYYVRDNGVGIDPKHQDRVFNLFEQLDPSKEGSGVGLAIARRIVELHGGRIWVESEGLGKGATFCFTLAKAPAAVVEGTYEYAK